MKNSTISLIALLVLCVFLFSGCASINEDDCAAADWRAMGYRHGKAGGGAYGTGLDRYMKACVKVNIMPDKVAYEEGRAEGARLYCRAENGFVVGHSGATYHYTCDPDLEGAFLQEYNLGKELFAYENAVRVVENEIYQLQNQRVNIKDSITHNTLALTRIETTMEERVLLGVDINRLMTELDNVDKDLERLTYQLAIEQERLDDYRHSQGY